MDKLPLIIESELFVRSVEQKTLQAKSRILGARHGDFILIEQPICEMNERLRVPMEGDILCSFFYEGEIFRFMSRIRKEIAPGLSIIDYPTRIQKEAVRRHHRIQVHIEVRFRLENTTIDTSTIRKRADLDMEGTIFDISKGGCFLVVPSMLHVTKNMACKLSFVLPDEQKVDMLQGRVRAVAFHRVKKSTDLGLQFLGPVEELAKIASFCDYCMYFKV